MLCKVPGVSGLNHSGKVFVHTFERERIRSAKALRLGYPLPHSLGDGAKMAC